MLAVAYRLDLSLMRILQGVCRATPALVASFMIASLSSFGFALLGGLCLFYLIDLGSTVDAFIGESSITSADSIDRNQVSSLPLLVHRIVIYRLQLASFSS